LRQKPRALAQPAPLKLSQTFDHESFAIEYLREADPRVGPSRRAPRGPGAADGVSPRAAGVRGLRRGRAVRVGEQKQALFSPLGLRRACFWVSGLYAAFSDTHPFYLLPSIAPFAALLELPGRPAQSKPRLLFALLAAHGADAVIFLGKTAITSWSRRMLVHLGGGGAA